MLHVMLLCGDCRSQWGYTEWRKNPCGPKWSSSLCSHLPLCTSVTLHKSSLTCVLNKKPSSANDYTFKDGNGTFVCGDNTRIIKSKGNGYKCVPVLVANMTRGINTLNGQLTVTSIDFSRSTHWKPQSIASIQPYHNSKKSDVLPRPNKNAWHPQSFGQSSYGGNIASPLFGSRLNSNQQRRIRPRPNTNQQPRFGSKMNSNQLSDLRYGSIANERTQNHFSFNKFHGAGRNKMFNYIKQGGVASETNNFNRKAIDNNLHDERIMKQQSQRRQRQEMMPRFMRPRQQKRDLYHASRKSGGFDPNARTKWLLGMLGKH